MEKTRIIELLKKYGYNTISFQSIMGGFSYFESAQGIEGFIPYIKIKRTFLAAVHRSSLQEKMA